MSVVIVLVLASLFFAVVFLVAFIWAVKSGQYKDDYSPAVRALFDDGVTKKKPKKESEKAKKDREST